MVIGEALLRAVWVTMLVTGAGVILSVLVSVVVVFGHCARIASVSAAPESESPA